MMPTTRATSTPSRKLTIRASNMVPPPLRGISGPPRCQAACATLAFLAALAARDTLATLPALAALAARSQGTAVRGGAGLAQPVDLQAVGARHEAVSAADLRLQRGDSRAQELHHPAADRAYQVIVPLPAVNVLVEVAPAPEPLLAGETARHQQIEIAVDGRPRDLQAAAARRRQEMLGVDVIMLAKDLVEQGEPFGSDPLPPLPQEAQEALFLPLIGHLEAGARLQVIY
jgi:hypothetical protein